MYETKMAPVAVIRLRGCGRWMQCYVEQLTGSIRSIENVGAVFQALINALGPQTPKKFRDATEMRPQKDVELAEGVLEA